MRKRSFSNNVLEEKCRFLFEISLPFISPGFDAGGKVLGVAVRPPRIWYNGHVFFLPTAFLLLQIAPLLSHFCRSLSFHNFLRSVASLFSKPIPLHFSSFRGKYSRGKYCEARILRKIIGGILEVKFFFFLPLSRNHSLVWKNIFFFLCDSRGEEEW